MALTQERKQELVTQFGDNDARHRQHPRPGRAADRAHQPAHRASALEQEGPPLAPRPADARRPPPPAAELLPEARPRGLPRADQGARACAGEPSSRPGTTVPEFTLRREDGETFTRDDLAGQTTVLVFYPFAFSSVCTDQFQIYEEVLDDLAAAGATLYGVSSDPTDSQTAFRESVGVTIRALGLRAQGRARARRSAPTSRPAAPTARSSSSGPTSTCSGRWRRAPRRSCRARTSSSTGSPSTPAEQLRHAARRGSRDPPMQGLR